MRLTSGLLTVALMPQGWASRGHACSPQLSTCGPSPLPEACMEQTPHSFQKLNMELNIQRVYHVEKPIIYVISADPKPTRVSSDMTHNGDKACRMGLRLVPRCREGAGVLSHHAGHLQVPLPGALTRGGPCTPHARTGTGTTETELGEQEGADPLGTVPEAPGKALTPSALALGPQDPPDTWEGEMQSARADGSHSVSARPPPARGAVRELLHPSVSGGPQGGRCDVRVPELRGQAAFLDVGYRPLRRGEGGTCPIHSGRGAGFPDPSTN